MLEVHFKSLQKLERKTHPEVEQQENAEPLKQQEVEGKISRYQCNVKKVVVP
jgi:hypothetical protein